MRSPVTSFTREIGDRAVRGGPALVVHPLVDDPEPKPDIDRVPPMPMTPGVRVWLVVLRVYVIGMTVMLAYRVLEVAGHLGPHFR